MAYQKLQSSMSQLEQIQNHPKFRSIHNPKHQQKLNQKSKIYGKMELSGLARKLCRSIDKEMNRTLGGIYYQMNPTQQEIIERKFSKADTNYYRQKEYLNKEQKEDLKQLQIWENTKLKPIQENGQQSFIPLLNKKKNDSQQQRNNSGKLKDDRNKQNLKHYKTTDEISVCTYYMIKKQFDHYEFKDQLNKKIEQIGKQKEFNRSKNEFKKQSSQIQSQNKQTIKEVKQYVDHLDNLVYRLKITLNGYLRQNQQHIKKMSYLERLITHLMKGGQCLSDNRQYRAPKKRTSNASNIVASTVIGRMLRERKKSFCSQDSSNLIRGRSTKHNTNENNKSVHEQQDILISKFIDNIADKNKALENYRNEKVQLGKNVQQNQENITYLNLQVENHSVRLNQMQDMLDLVYRSILKEGRDCRDTGLVWTIKYLIKQGINIGYDELPMFIDEESKGYLVSRARKEIEIEDQQQLQNTILNLYKEYIQGYDSYNDHSSNSYLCNQTDDVDLDNQKESENNENQKQQIDHQRQLVYSILYKDFLKQKKKKQSFNSIVYCRTRSRIKEIMGSDINIEKQQNLTLFSSNQDQKQINRVNHIQIYQNDTLLNDYKTKLDFIVSYQQMDQKINTLQKELKLLNSNEKKRIQKMFIFKDYEQKFNVPIQQYLGCLFGVEQAQKIIFNFCLNNN